MELPAFSAGRAELANAVHDVARFLPTRTVDPVLTGVLVTASADGLVLAGTDRERAVRLSCPTTVHTDGTVLVPGRPLAETLRALADAEVRVAVEGSRLAIRTSRARFALPLLDVDVHPGVAPPPPLAGWVAGALALPAFTSVAGAASKDDALPLFTGVRIRAHTDSLRLIATDRYRMALAELPWRRAEGAGELDVLVPAGLLTEIVRQAAGAPEIALHADVDRAAVAWGDRVVSTALLATPFPDENRYLGRTGDASVELAPAELAGAVHRVGLYAGGRGAVTVDLADGEVRVRTDSAELGEAEESVKASVTGRLSQTYRVRYLLDALRAFGGEQVRLDIRSGMKSTVFSADEPDGTMLRYLVMPILPSGR
ncbi:MAG TPA: DNA polymerase III subunit beta [Pseudonocardiaceae bacterium]|jgi:DNA polymerase-3 subunit beta|nr:DNA polymerase III subunit beta [Pseudonocardiaceae bacterium]